MSSEHKTIEGVSSRTDSNDSPQTVEVDGETYEYTTEKPWRDADLLEELYWEKEMTQIELGDVFGCSQNTISSSMKNLDVATRGRGRPSVNRATYYYKNGYMVWTEQTQGSRVSVHRLLAVAEYGFEAVCGKDVHHKNHIPWDNRSQNIELKTREQHVRDHGLERFNHKKAPWRGEDKLRELYVEQKLNTYEIADKWGCDARTVGRWLDKHGIETRSRSEAAKLREADDDQQTLTEAE